MMNIEVASVTWSELVLKNHRYIRTNARTTKMPNREPNDEESRSLREQVMLVVLSSGQ